MQCHHPSWCFKIILIGGISITSITFAIHNVPEDKECPEHEASTVDAQSNEAVFLTGRVGV